MASLELFLNFWAFDFTFFVYDAIKRSNDCAFFDKSWLFVININTPAIVEYIDCVDMAEVGRYSQLFHYCLNDSCFGG